MRTFLAVIIFLLFAGSYALWTRKAMEVTPPDVGFKKVEHSVLNPLTEEEAKKLISNLKAETASDKLLTDIIDFSKAPNTFVQTENAGAYLKTSSAVIASINECVKKNTCGIETTDKADDQSAPLRLLARSVEVIRETLVKKAELSNELDWNLMREISRSNQERIRFFALDLLINFDLNNRGAENFIKQMQTYKGQARGDFFRLTANFLLTAERGIYLDAISKTFKEDDFETVLSVVDKLPKIKLQMEEIKKVEKDLCHFKSNEANWNKISDSMRAVSSDLNAACTH